MVLRRLLRVPWTARRSNQSILKEISPGCSLAGLMLKLKLQYFGHLMRRVDSLEKTLMLGGLAAGAEGDDRGWDGWMASQTQWAWGWLSSGSWWWTGRPGMLRFMGLQRVGHDWATELNWTEMFFWSSLAFSKLQQMLAIWSLVPLLFLNSAWTSGRSWSTYSWRLAWRILSVTLLAREMSTIVR